MLPNRFPDAGEAPEYNTADASLWFFVAVHEYLRATDDREFAAEIYPTLQDMLEWHVRGTRFGIRMDPRDGLLRAGEAGVQLTWMDAKVGDWVVTPRIGKPVEINALWFNAVCILRDLAADLGHSEERSDYAARAAGIARELRTRRSGSRQADICTTSSTAPKAMPTRRSPPRCKPAPQSDLRRVAAASAC